MISRTGRPIVALARLPEPKALQPPFMPISAATGPLTISRGAAACVVAWTPFKLNAWSVSVFIAARTTGAYLGLHPAMTSRVSTPQRGATLHSTMSGSPPRASTIAATFSRVGETTGRPSVQPRSKYASTKLARLIPAALMIDPCPGAAGDRINALLVADEEIPSLLAGCDDGLIVVPDKPAELVTTQVVPNVLHWVEFW